MAIETYFKNIASAIKTKGGTVATLTPSQMPQAIADLPSGGGGEYTPKYQGFSYLYASGQYAKWDNGDWYNNYYELTAGKKYIIVPGDNGAYQRWVITFYENVKYADVSDKILNEGTATAQNILSNGTSLAYISGGSAIALSSMPRIIITPASDGLLICTTSHGSVSYGNYPSYVFEL